MDDYEQEWADAWRQWAEIQIRFPEFNLPTAECMAGWYPIIERLLVELREIAPRGSIRVVQVKEKLGELRVYWDGPVEVQHDERVSVAVFAAECRAVRSCEICGKPGLRRIGSGGWLSTRCDGHAPPKSRPTHSAEEQRSWQPEMRSYRKGQPDSVWRYDPTRDAVVAVEDER